MKTQQTFTCFAIFIQLLSRGTSAVKASYSVTAKSLAASVGFLTFIHICREEKQGKINSTNVHTDKPTVPNKISTSLQFLTFDQLQ